jgi:hypothetical protein
MQKRRTLTVLAVLVAIAAAAYGARVLFPPRAAVRQALLDELTTVTLENCTLRRYGSANDGGYLMCENLLKGVEIAYSYGIDTEDNWGCEVSKELGVAVHQYDCFTPHRPVCKGGRFVFHDECVGADSETVDGERFDTIESQIARNRDTKRSVLLKIDVEGAEWDSLMAVPDEVFDRISQMPMELHGTDQKRFLQVLRRLKERFYLVNLHFNNQACTPDAAPLPAFAFQVLLVNKTVGVLDTDGPSPAPMSALNAPDAPHLPDCQLAPPAR